MATAFERINRGGSRAAYRSMVMEWSAAVLDAAIIKPADGKIDVYPLMVGGVPTASEAADLLAYLKPRTPMGDFITVVNPAPFAFTFVLTLLMSNPAAKPLAEADHNFADSGGVVRGHVPRSPYCRAACGSLGGFAMHDPPAM